MNGFIIEIADRVDAVRNGGQCPLYAVRIREQVTKALGKCANVDHANYCGRCAAQKWVNDNGVQALLKLTAGVGK